MPRTSGTYTGSYTSFGTYTTIQIGYSPATITSTGAVVDSASTGSAVYQGQNDSGGTLFNDGQVSATGGATGISWGSGSLVNAGTVSSSGGGTGVSAENLSNSGLIEAMSGTAVQLSGGGIFGVTSSNSGTIEATGNGGQALFVVSTNPVSNSGTIEATGTSGVGVNATSMGINLVNTGLIEATGSAGIGIRGSGSVGNEGTVLAIGSGGIGIGLGAAFSGGGVLQLKNSGLIEGATGVNLHGVSQSLGGTIVNSGTIAGTAGIAIELSAQDAVLVEEATGVLIGSLDGFKIGDTIDLAGVTYSNVTYGYSAGTLSIQNGTTAASFHLTNFNNEYHFHLLSDGGGGTEIRLQLPCLCAGTRIRTDHSDAAVESLRIGDSVMTFSGELRPIKWIGRRSYRQPLPEGDDIVPILIRRDALGDGLPVRDLFVSPRHAILIDNMLVPAGLLVNGVSIVRASNVQLIEYFHIELQEHDVIFAEGVPTETFLDRDSRSMFQNADEYLALYPDDDQTQQGFCAPRIESGAIVRTIWHRIAGLAKVGAEAA